MFYVYDGTFEGFLSAVTVIMRAEKNISEDKQPFFGIVRDNGVPLLLDYQTVSVIPNILFDFGNYVQRNFGGFMNKTIYHAFLSEVEGIETAITDYIFLARRCHCDPIDQLYQDCVKKVADAAKTVTREAHHYLGLLRFRKLKAPSHSNESRLFSSGEKSVHFDGDEKSTPSASENNISPLHSESSFSFSSGESTSLTSTASAVSTASAPSIASEEIHKPRYSSEKSDSFIADKNTTSSDKGKVTLLSLFENPMTADISSVLPEIFIAECEPVTCSLPLIAEHFVERLPNQLFIIFDWRRKICVIHVQGNSWTMVPCDPSIDFLKVFDSSFEDLWQTYFKVLAIPERINLKLQRGNMPKRYWKYLIEHPGK